MSGHRVAVGADHAGFDLKEEIKSFLDERGEIVEDYGTDSRDSVDYPDYGRRVAEAVSAGRVPFGILTCGTGIGMSIVANKHPGVRAALVQDLYSARMAREHVDANLLILGARVTRPDLARQFVEMWLDAEFQGDRHQRRINKIAELDKEKATS
ncbi:MAG: ribose 5-phosphate isomerase B [Nitrospinota bacterium]